MAINENELRAAIEAVLLVAGEPTQVGALVEVFGEKEKASIEARLEEIRVAYEQGSGGFTLEQAAGGWRFVTRPEYDVYLKKFFSKQGEGRLSIASLETLSIVAYKQPITAPEIADIRGVNSSGVLRTLLDRKLIRIAGRKNVVGSPFLYKTTKEFLLHFGLNSIQDLPRLEEFAEILGEGLADDLLGGETPVDVIEGEGEASPNGVDTATEESGEMSGSGDSEAASEASASDGAEQADGGSDAVRHDESGSDSDDEDDADEEDDDEDEDDDEESAEEPDETDDASEEKSEVE